MSITESTLETSEFTASPGYDDTTAEGLPLFRPATQPSSVKIYYYVDEQTTPYCTTIPVPPSKFTLSHFKCALNNQNFKCYVKQMDEALNTEVKAEILSDSQLLEPDSQGNYFFYLLTTDENRPKNGTLKRKNKQPVSMNPPKQMVAVRKQSHAFHEPVLRRRRQSRHEVYAKPERMLDDSSGEESSCQFTSISEQEEKGRHYRNRGRRRGAWSPSFLSTTMETDVSVSLNLITVTLNLDSVKPFGMNVVLREKGGQQMLCVNSVLPGGIVALDGRIRPGHIIIEVNGTPLSDLTGDEAVKLLKTSVDTASRRHGSIKMTLSEGIDRLPFFLPPDDTILPIDTEAWVRNTMQATGLAYGRGADKIYSISSSHEFHQRPVNTATWPSSGVGSSIASSAHSKRFTAATPLSVISQAMCDPNYGIIRRHARENGLNIKDCFLGTDLINWVSDNICGLDDLDTSARFVEGLIKDGYLIPLQPGLAVERAGYYAPNYDKVTRHDQHMNTIKRGELELFQDRPALDETAFEKKPGCFTSFFCFPNRHNGANGRRNRHK